MTSIRVKILNTHSLHMRQLIIQNIKKIIEKNRKNKQFLLAWYAHIKQLKILLHVFRVFVYRKYMIMKMNRIKNFIIKSQKKIRQKIQKMVYVTDEIQKNPNKNIRRLNYNRIVSSFSFLFGNQVTCDHFSSKVNALFQDFWINQIKIMKHGEFISKCNHFFSKI